MNSRLITILLFVLIAIVGWKAFTIAGISSGTGNVTAYQSVMDTKVLRCGYASLPPFITVAPDGGIQGPTYDIMNEVGKRLGLSVEWSEETGYGQIPAGLQAGRFDAFCGVLWATTIRASAILFTKPTHYMPVYACVRGDTTEYDTDTSALNAPDKKFSVYDGDISKQLTEVLFPQAQLLAVSPMATAGEWMEQVATGKADAISTCDKVFFDAYNKTNPGKVKIAAPDKPLTHVQVVFGLPMGENNLKAMIDQALFEMTADGTIARIFNDQLGAEAREVVLPAAP